MNTDHLRPLVGAPGPFVSLYIDDTRDTDDALQRAGTRWDAIRRHLEDAGVTEHVIGAVERAVLRGQPAAGRRGRAVIAGREGVLINEYLGDPPPITLLRVSEYPYLLPLVEQTPWRRPYVFVAVDHLGADIIVHQHGAVSTEIVRGEGFPVHKPNSAGWHGYGDHQHTTEEAVRMNVRKVAGRVIDVVDGSDAELVLLCGEVRARADVIAALPRRIAERVVSQPAGARGGRATESEVTEMIDAEFSRRRRDAVNVVLARFEAEDARSSGMAVQGLSDVCAALRDGAVETLIVGDLGSATVVCGQDRMTIAPTADSLSELGEAPSRIALAEEALPFVAISTDSAVMRPDSEVCFTDGIAALLRYPQVRAVGSRTAAASPAAPGMK